MIIPALLLAVPAALVLKQPDLGTALILVLITATLIFVGGLNWRTLVVADARRRCWRRRSDGII